MMNHLQKLRSINATAAFNCWAKIEMVAAQEGMVTLTMPWRNDLGQYSGFLHAGIIGALIDTACGFAAATVAGPVLASHYSVDCLAPAVGATFIVESRVVKAGRKQIFAEAELFAVSEGSRKLVAAGRTILVPIGAGALK